MISKVRIPFCDLARALDPIAANISDAMARVMSSGWFLRGREVESFEAEWAAYCGQEFCVSCNSGTDALTIAALALGMEQALVQANTVPLTAIGLKRAGVRVHFCDVDPDGHLDISNTNCVPVLIYGRCPSSTELESVFFDAAHAHGWKPPLHAVACWSFYPTKTLGALGDAGAVTTNDRVLAERMRNLCGRDDVLRDSRQITSRMDELQAAILRVKLCSLDRWLADRGAIARQYELGLAGTNLLVNRSVDSFNHLIVIRSNRRDELAMFLKSHGVETKIHWPTPLHKLNGWEPPQSSSLPNAETWCDEVLSLPCYPGLTEDEIDAICGLVREFRASSWQPLCG
jgi:dTDP-4-amino-4,6-dideoxygalactose transaminase